MDDSTTKRCTKCGETKALIEFHKNKSARDGHARWCKLCYKAHMSAPEQRERKSEYDRQRLEAKGDEIRAKARQHYATDEAHREKHKAYEREKRARGVWREYDRQRYHKRMADPAWRAADRERRRRKWHTDPEWRQRRYQGARRYELENPHGRIVRRIANQKRRHLARTLPNTLTKAEWFEILERQNHCCPACLRPFGPLLKPTMDHITPLVQNGPLTKDNVQALCRSCNAKKFTKNTDYRPDGDGS